MFLVYVSVSSPRFGRIRDNVSRAESLPVEKKSSVAQKIRYRCRSDKEKTEVSE